MKKLCVFFCSISFLAFGQTAIAQEDVSHETVIINVQKGKTEVHVNHNGELILNVSPKEIEKFIATGFVKYSNFGTNGDGKTDDINAIAATHAFANQHGLSVKSDKGASYYIGRHERTAIIQTDTDFSTANFIIDDRDVENRNTAIFKVSSNLKSIKLEGIKTLKRNQEKIDASLPASCLITVTNSHLMHYIRYGLNVNNGSAQTDIFLVDKNGNVDANAPIIWDFDQITEISALPINEKILNITGGRFTTIANKEESFYNYYHRNIAIQRSNVLIDGLEHRITGEEDHGAPYNGFISVSDCAFVTVKNTLLTGHKTYVTIGRAGKPVSMGTYDLSISRALNVSFVNCSQTNDINNRTYWGILGSNYCKNLLYDNCTLSRFDAHKGVANATIRNSVLGHMGINAIGSGTLTIENSTIQGWSLVNLRSDYGSTWQGELIIRNCIFKPREGTGSNISLIGGSYSGQHNFGYICYMPEKITIENLLIDDSKAPADYQGPAIFTDFNTEMTDDSYHQEFPYVISKKVFLKNISTASSKELRVSDNEFMFRDLKVYKD
jgi:hypothetical protein